MEHWERCTEIWMICSLLKTKARVNRREIWAILNQLVAKWWFLLVVNLEDLWRVPEWKVSNRCIWCGCQKHEDRTRANSPQLEGTFREIEEVNSVRSVPCFINLKIGLRSWIFIRLLMAKMAEMGAETSLRLPKIWTKCNEITWLTTEVKWRVDMSQITKCRDIRWPRAVLRWTTMNA